MALTTLDYSQNQGELLLDRFEFDFEAWEAEVIDIDLELQAKEAFDGILSFESVQPNTIRTISDIKTDIDRFLSNPEIIQIQRVVNNAAIQFAQFCDHNHLADSQIGENLQGFYDQGKKSLAAVEQHSDKDNHKDKQTNIDDDQYEIDPKTGKKTKKKRRWFSF